MRFLMLLGVFEVSLRNVNMLARMRMHLHFITGKIGWPLLLFELLALTFFAALLALRASRIVPPWAFR